MPYLAVYKDGRVLLRLYVQPRASKNRVVGLHDGTVKLGITAAPVDGKANAAVLKFLASFLKVKKKDLEIRHGLQSRNKTVLVAGLDEETVRRKIEAVL
jgi:uncharacterized protein (TIGR00251 family)